MPVVFDEVQATVAPDTVATPPPPRPTLHAPPAPPKPDAIKAIQRHLDRRAARLKAD